MTKQPHPERVAHFRSLHDPGDLLVLPNAWDPGSARLVESCGARAIATTSAGLAWARGYPDGGILPRQILLDEAAAILRVVALPVTVDIEDGYSSDPNRVGDLAFALASQGVVGINIEDRMAAPETLCAKIRSISRRLASSGLDLFVNARIDAFLHARDDEGPEERLDQTTRRARLYRDAGCDGIFVPGLRSPDDIRRIAAATDLPLNLMTVPGLASLEELVSLGVRRLSAGAAISAACLAHARALARALLLEGPAQMFRGREFLDYAEANSLFAPRGEDEPDGGPLAA